MGKKKIYLVWIIMVLLVMIVGSYAYFSWKTSESRLVLTVGDINNIQVVLKPYRIDAEMVPVSTYESESYVNVDVINSSNKSKGFELYYRVNTIDKELRSSDFKYTITKSTDGGSTYSEVKTGNFSEAVDSTDITIYSATVSSKTTEKYRVYVWLSNNGDQSNVSGASFNAELRAEFDSSSNIVVDVPEGLIPVVFDTSDGTVIKTVSKDDESWYDYNSQEWANAVLVKSSGTQTRSYYSTNNGVVVNQNDILAYYTYIPRYKYKIWGTGKEQTIDIQFESASMKKSTDTTVGSYLTHPAFTFGGTELNGIWVGKFETTGTADEPTVLPDVTALTTQSTSNQLKTSLKFSGGNLSSGGSISFSGNTTYGLTTDTNSHMMKNREWGAVAYLSHSKYGTNKEIYINNSSLHYTGRSGGNVPGSTPINGIYTDQTSTELYNEYGYYTWDGYLLSYGTNTKSSTRDLTKAASTTENITGVYDMVGGANEYVMGVFANSSGQLWSGNSTTWNSGFTGLMGESGESYTGTSFPDSKYYDVYKASSGITISDLTACNGGVCYGHALSETGWWYNDGYALVSASQPWFVRGGNFDWGTGSGIFFIGGLGGDPGGNYGFRSVIIYDPPGKVTVSFDSNGGSSCAGGTYDAGVVYGTLCTPSKSGYSFFGWYNKDEYNEYTLSSGMMENDDHVFGPNVSLDAGKYVAEITGSNLSGLSFDIYTSADASVIPYDNITITDTKVTIYFTLNKTVSSVEIRTIKNGSTFTFDSLKIYSATTSDSIVPTGSHTLTAEYIDDIAPTGTVQATLSGSIISASVSATDTGSGIKEYGYLIQKNNTTCPTSGYTVSSNSSYTFNVSTNGTYTVCVKVVDNAGNIGYISNTIVNDITSLTVNLNGGSTSQTFTSTYKENTTIALTTPTRPGYTFTGWKVTSGSSKILNNMVVNGNFESGSNNWSLSNASITTSEKYSGSNSLLFSSGTTVMTTQTLSQTAPILNHKYYGSLMFKAPSGFTITDARFEWYTADADGALMTFAQKVGTDGAWKRYSGIGQITSSSYLSNSWYLRNFVVSGSANSYVDDIIIIDLTESYGSGNEPTKEWLDANVGYFDNYMLVIGDTDSTLEALWEVSDTTAPTCSLSVSGTTITGSYADEGGSGVVYYGYSSSMTGTSTATKTISSTGTYTFYVKDGVGNNTSCSLGVIATTSSTDCSSWGSYYCTSWGSYYCKSSTGNACGNQSCCASEGGTWTRDCNKYGRDCNSYTTTYSCASGYTKANNSYCYKIN